MENNILFLISLKHDLVSDLLLRISLECLHISNGETITSDFRKT